jgi:hypothetical protein
MYSLHNKQSRAHAFHSTFFKSSLEFHPAALQCINKTIYCDGVGYIKMHDVQKVCISGL